MESIGSSDWKSRKSSDLPTKDSTSSFWHSQPSPLLTAHRSTRELPKSADVVIIGSGITGASVAHHLLVSSEQNSSNKVDDDGPTVVMLEAREACWGATGRNGGHCHPLPFEHPHDPSIGSFELGNYYAIQSLIYNNSIDCEFVAQSGVRGIYSQSMLNTIELALHTIESNAPDTARLLRLVTDPDELIKLRLPTAKGAVITTIAARMWPYKFVSRILEDLIKSNELRGTFNLQTLTPVDAIKPSSPDTWTVKTSRGDIVASKVILATNAYTSHLLPSFSDLIVPCRGQMSSLNPLPSVAGENRLQTSYGFGSEGIDDYLIQRPNESGGHLMFGGGRQCGPSIGISDDSVTDEKTAYYLRTALIDAFGLPEGNNRKDVAFNASHMWTGIMGFSRDDVPWVGPVPDHSNVYMSAGYTGHGMPNAWLCGQAVAEMVQHSWNGDSPLESLPDAPTVRRLPKCYLITRERYNTARQIATVEERDWAEMDRGRHDGTSIGIASGYA